MKKVEISVSFILEAHKAACSDWKRKIEEELGDDWETVCKLNGRHRNPVKGDFLYSPSEGKVYIVDDVRGEKEFRWDANYMVRPLYIGGHANAEEKDKYFSHGTHEVRFATEDEIKSYLTNLRASATSLIATNK